jgi:hypothetical protein
MLTNVDRGSVVLLGRKRIKVFESLFFRGSNPEVCDNLIAPVASNTSASTASARVIADRGRYVTGKLAPDRRCCQSGFQKHVFWERASGSDPGDC